MATKREVIMTAQDIQRSLSRMALQIVERNRNEESLAIVGIHTGGVYLADRIRDIIREREEVDTPAGNLDITLYRDDWSLASQNPVVKKTHLPFSVEGRPLILVDDVIFTGRTIRAALDAVMDFGRPKSIQLAVLVDRGGRELPIQPDYTGLSIDIGLHDHVHVLLEEGAAQDEVVLEANP